MEPLNNGHIGTNHFVLYREVVLSLDVKCTSIIEKGLQSVSFIERFFLLCPLLGVSIIRGSTVYCCRLVWTLARGCR